MKKEIIEEALVAYKAKIIVDFIQIISIITLCIIDLKIGILVMIIVMASEMSAKIYINIKYKEHEQSTR